MMIIQLNLKKKKIIFGYLRDRNLMLLLKTSHVIQVGNDFVIVGFGADLAPLVHQLTEGRDIRHPVMATRWRWNGRRGAVDADVGALGGPVDGALGTRVDGGRWRRRDLRVVVAARRPRLLHRMRVQEPVVPSVHGRQLLHLISCYVIHSLIQQIFLISEKKVNFCPNFGFLKVQICQYFGTEIQLGKKCCRNFVLFK